LKQYLLDTNIIIFYFKEKFDLDIKIDEIGIENCFVSEITIAELLHGAEKSLNPIKNLKLIDEILKNITVVPIFSALRIYAKEKMRLEKKGKSIDNFDLLIGATAFANNLIMVTNNTKHFNRFENLELEDWTI
jgi:tRNA(fMet)-specific endonuclease VapC